MHKATSRFWEGFRNLPEPIQRLAKKNFELLKVDTQHPSLHFKKIGQFWSVRIGLNYRALAVKQDDDYIWVWIGTHDAYDRLIN